MANVATITASFRAEAAQFLKELEKVNRESKRTGESITKEIGGALRTLGAVVSAGAFVGFVRGAAQAADQTAKTADKLGIATERLQALRFAARGAGVDVGTLDKALFEAQKRLTDAATGKGDAADWLRRLNLNARELMQLRPDELFIRYAEAIGTLSTRGQQFTAAQALMGKGAQDLVNLLDGGRPAIHQAAKDIEDLGIKLTRVDAKQIEMANDEIERMKAVSEGIGQQFAVAVSPYVAEFAREIVNAAKSGDGLRSNIETIVRGAYYGFQIAANAVRVFDVAISATVATIANLGESLGDLDKVGLGPLAKRIRDFGAATKEELLELSGKALEGAADLSPYTGPIERGLDSLGKKVAEFGKRGAEVQGFWAGVAEVAAQRVQNALGQIKSFEQIGQEADRIVAEGKQRAQEAVAAQRAIAAGGRVDVAGGASSSSVDMQAYIQAEYDRALKREQIWAKFDEEWERRRAESAMREARTRQQITEKAEFAMRAMREQTTNHAINFLQMLGQRHKAAAFASIILEKAIAIKRIIMQTQVAATLAFASQLIPGDPSSVARAVAARRLAIAQGFISGAIVAAEGVMQLQDVNAGNTGPGTSTNPIFTQPTTPGSAGGIPTERGAITINFHGFANEQNLRDLAEMLRTLDDRDVIFVTGDSGNARVIRDGG